MGKLRRILLTTATLIVTIFITTGCSVNKDSDDFTFMKDKNISKIAIQSMRDKTYKFTVTDKGVINSIYKILSKAKEVNSRSDLDADYLFEIYEGPDKVYKFNYITGLDRRDGGNFYSEDKNYIVSKRLDNDIIKNFWNIRKPIDFQRVYYDSILQALDLYIKESKKETKIGVNIEDDLEMSKFILSTDLVDFKKRLSKFSSVQLIEKDKEKDFDITMSIVTEGYTSDKYKAVVTFKGKAGENDVKYYIYDKYNKGEWDIQILKEKPEDF